MKPAAPHRGAGGGQGGHAVGEAEGDTFQNGLDHLSPRAVRRQPEQDAAGERVVVRRALAREVGQEQQRAGAGKACLHLGEERRNVVASGDAAHGGERAGPVEHGRHGAPARGQAMAETVDGMFGRRAVTIGRDEDLRRCAERHEGAAILDDADPEAAGQRIAGPHLPR